MHNSGTFVKSFFLKCWDTVGNRRFHSHTICKRNQKISTIIPPWERYVYTRPPMNILCALGILIYHDEFIMCSGLSSPCLNWWHIFIPTQRQNRGRPSHKKVKMVITWLQDKGYQTTSLQKPFFMEKEVEYLSFLLTSKIICPQPKKVEAIDQMEACKNLKQLKQFLGAVNFDQEIRPRQSHIL